MLSMFSSSNSSGEMVFNCVPTFTGYGVTLYLAVPSVSIKINWSKLLFELGTFFAHKYVCLVSWSTYLTRFLYSIGILSYHSRVCGTHSGDDFFAHLYIFITFTPSCLTNIDLSPVRMYPRSGVFF